MKIINSAHRQTSCLTSATPIPITTDNRSTHKNRRPTLAGTGLKKKKSTEARRARERVNERLMDRATI